MDFDGITLVFLHLTFMNMILCHWNEIIFSRSAVVQTVGTGTSESIRRASISTDCSPSISRATTGHASIGVKGLRLPVETRALLWRLLMTSRLIWGMEGTNYLKRKKVTVKKEKEQSARLIVESKNWKCTYPTAVVLTAALTAPQDAVTGCWKPDCNCFGTEWPGSKPLSHLLGGRGH